MSEAAPPDAAVDVAAQVRDEQIKLFFRNARFVILPNLITFPALVFVLWDRFPRAELSAWGALGLAATAARSALAAVYARRRRNLEENIRWGWGLTALTTLSGAVFGAAGFLFLDAADPVSLAFLVVALAGMVSAAVGSQASFLPAFVLYAVACLVPLSARCFWQWSVAAAPQGRPLLMLAILSMVYLLVQLAWARNTQRMVVESIRLRFENLGLVAQLRLEKERAEAASLAKSKFLAAASHDLRQPLHALGLFVDALRGEPLAPKPARIVASVEESHRATTELLDDLLDFSKLDAGIVRPSLASFPARQLLDQLRADFALQASAADLELRVRACSLPLRSDPVLLARMLRNLVANAIHYTEEGRVVVGCRREAGHVRIEVHDTGVGIPKPLHQAVFREFYQVEDGANGRRRSGGMGLGLAIVAGLSKALDHAVTLSSTPGKGSVFAVRVPIGDPGTAAAASPMALSDALRAKTILVIDDEPAIRDAVAAVLLGWGCDPVTAASAEGALEAFAARGGRPDAMLVDSQLERGASGRDAIARLEAVFGASVPAIIVTGDTRPERLREASEIGCPLLYKPLAPMRLRAALTAALHAGAPGAQAESAPATGRG